MFPLSGSGSTPVIS